MRAEHARRAAHVELHLVHLGRGLERDAAGVEGDALADERDRLRLRRPAAVLQRDELGRLRAALRDRRAACPCRASPCRRARAPSPSCGSASRARAPGRRDRSACRRWAEGCRGPSRGSMPSATASPCASPRRGAARGGAVRRRRTRAACSAGAVLLARALHAAEAVRAFARDRHGVRGFPRGVAPADGELGEVAAPRPRRRCALSARTAAATASRYCFSRNFSAAAQADQQHALGGDAGHVVQEQRRAGLALHVAAVQDAGEVALRGAIEARRRRRKACAARTRRPPRSRLRTVCGAPLFMLNSTMCSVSDPVLR